MTESLAQLKKSRGKSFDSLNDQLQKMSSGANYSNDNEWKLTVDKSGIGGATIRFLPAPPKEDVPFVRIWDHGFQGPGGWYIEKSLTTIGQDDPVSEMNTELWNTGNPEDKKTASARKRRLKYYTNIYVVKDPANPENEGKVFLYACGAQVFGLLKNAMQPEFEDETEINPFDFWEGANLKLKGKIGENGYRTYAPSSFEPVGPIRSPKGEELSDEEIEVIWNSQNSLEELVDAKNYKTYNELKAKLNKALKISDSIPSTPAPDSGRTVERDDDEPSNAWNTSVDDDEDDDDSPELAAFKALAEG